eukprot:3697788-Pyramimonas_sp.AAC.2
MQLSRIPEHRLLDPRSCRSRRVRQHLRDDAGEHRARKAPTAGEQEGRGWWVVEKRTVCFSVVSVSTTCAFCIRKPVAHPQHPPFAASSVLGF